MLTLTANARHALREISTRAGLPAEGGLRIAESAQDLGTFHLSLVPAPLAGDHVIEDEGARVFVEPLTASVLADQQLDAATSEEGTGFLLAPRE